MVDKKGLKIRESCRVKISQKSTYTHAPKVPSQQSPVSFSALTSNEPYSCGGLTIRAGKQTSKENEECSQAPKGDQLCPQPHDLFINLLLIGLLSA